MKRRTTVKWWRDELGLETKHMVETMIRTIVAKYPNGQALSTSDQEWLDKILRHHYQYKAKVGCGIKHLEVRSNPSWNGPSRGLWIVRHDGSEIDISWVVALKPMGRPDAKDDVSKAARYEVHPQIHTYHATGECDACPLCGEQLKRGSNVHVDHETPFITLLQGFLKFKALSFEDVEVEDLVLEARFADRELGSEWQEYHRQNAVLRITHAQCNLARKAA